MYYFLPAYRTEAYSMFAITLMMTLLVYSIKLIIKRPRPEFKDDRFLSVSFDIFSFPSGHATRSVYVGILMSIYTPQFAGIWIIWAIVMILSRLVLGVHFISDIIAGLSLGIVVVAIFFFLGWLPIFPFAEYLS